MKSPFICLVALLSLGLGMAHATYLDDIGYTDLQAELGGSLPDGSGVSVSQIEASDGGAYRPSTGAAQFTGITFTFPDPTPSGASGHATTVGSYFYGNSSMASGVTNVASYEANWWINNWLNSGTTTAPEPSLGKVQNFSWIGTAGDVTSDTFILARMDYAIDRDDILAVYGLNNNNAGNVPNLMVSGFNGISVGRTDGAHSYGTTHLTGVPIYGESRRKPDIVAPASATSWATPIVASAGTLLVDAGNQSGNPKSVHSEVLKATLMAGATKDEFADWNHTSTDPLDNKYGAGELNIANSYHIQAAGEQNGAVTPVTSVNGTGWDFGAIASSSMLYFFDLTLEGSFSAVLTWNIELVPNGDWSSIDLGLANLDLKLYEATAFTTGALVMESISSIDNVELLWAENLSAGRYALEVESDGLLTTDYGLAWLSPLNLLTIPEPNSTLLVALGGVLLILRKRVLRPSTKSSR